jgi:hypothetical protein
LQQFIIPYFKIYHVDSQNLQMFYSFSISLEFLIAFIIIGLRIIIDCQLDATIPDGIFIFIYNSNQIYVYLKFVIKTLNYQYFSPAGYSHKIHDNLQILNLWRRNILPHQRTRSQTGMLKKFNIWKNHFFKCRQLKLYKTLAFRIRYVSEKKFCFEIKRTSLNLRRFENWKEILRKTKFRMLNIYEYKRKNLNKKNYETNFQV